MTNKSNDSGVAAGVAALAICEALLLALGDAKFMGLKGVADVLHDTAAAHREGDPNSPNAAVHTEIVTIVERIIASAKALP